MGKVFCTAVLPHDWLMWINRMNDAPKKVASVLSLYIRPTFFYEILACVKIKTIIWTQNPEPRLCKPGDLFNLTYLSFWSNKCHCLLETNSWPSLLSVWLLHVLGFGREFHWGAAGELSRWGIWLWEISLTFWVLRVKYANPASSSAIRSIRLSYIWSRVEEMQPKKTLVFFTRGLLSS